MFPVAHMCCILGPKFAHNLKKKERKKNVCVYDFSRHKLYQAFELISDIFPKMYQKSISMALFMCVFLPVCIY